MRNKVIPKSLLLFFALFMFAMPLTRAKAADAQIYFACSNGIMPDNQWYDIDRHIMYQDFPMVEHNLLLSSIGVRLYAQDSNMLVYAEVFTDDQHFVKSVGRLTGRGSNWVYFDFGDKPIPAGNYHLWVWTNDGPGIYWGFANNGDCENHSYARIDLRADNNKDMAFAIYAKKAIISANNPATATVEPLSGSTTFQASGTQSNSSTPDPNSAPTPAADSGSGSQSSTSDPANLSPADIPPADQLSASQAGINGSIPVNQQTAPSQNSGTIAKVKEKIASIFKPNSSSSTSTWQAPTDDELLRMTYGDNYKNMKLTGFFPGVLFSFLAFLPIWLFVIILIIIIIIIVRRRKAKKAALESVDAKAIDKEKT